MAKTPRKKPAPKLTRNTLVSVPLPFDAFVGGVLKIDPKQLRTKRKAAPKKARKKQMPKGRSAATH